jgi:aryl-alcohol dehydrogenase-like predicted oxidoreductase
MRLGLGTWGLGGKDYGPISEKKAINLLFASFQKGIKFFDTAPIYGDGKSEYYLGKLIRKAGRKKVIICTKGGLLPHVGFDLKYDFSLNNLKKDLTNSLNRLKTDYIDYYLIHSPPISEINLHEITEFFKYQKERRIVKNFGISLRSPHDFVLIKNSQIDVVEFNFNLLDQRAIDIDLFSKLKNKKIKSICRTPLCFGFLTGKDLVKAKLDKKDHRKLFWSDKQFDLWNKSKNYFIDFYNRNNYADFSQFALHFCLSYNFNFVIPGIMNSKDLDLNIKSLNYLKMRKTELINIYSIYKKFEKKIYDTKK